jgi:ArsR family transcriptional regulator
MVRVVGATMRDFMMEPDWIWLLMPIIVVPCRGRRLEIWTLTERIAAGCWTSIEGCSILVALSRRQIDSSMSEAQLIAVLAALGHAVRLSLWRMLLPYGSDGLSAGTIAERMAIIPSSLSFHLRQMTQAGVLRQRRSSRNIVYAVNADVMEEVMTQLARTLPSGGRLSHEAGDIAGD